MLNEHTRIRGDKFPGLQATGNIEMVPDLVEYASSTVNGNGCTMSTLQRVFNVLSCIGLTVRWDNTSVGQKLERYQ